MTGTDIEKAARASRGRASLMAIVAMLLVITAWLGFNDAAPDAVRPMVRHFGWALMILLWLVVLATGGGLWLSKPVRSVMNDEVALANRGKALQAGFWAAMLTGLAIYFAGFSWDISLHEGLRVLVNLSIAAALIRYAWLELR